MFSPWDNTGSRIRRDEKVAEELLALPDDAREVMTRFIAKALDVEEIEDELAEAERELRKLQAAEDAAILAAQSDPTQDHIEALKAVIAANS